MKFSVLMSVYAKEKPEYLDAALESLIRQTRLPDEIVLVKDGPLTLELDRVIERYVCSRHGNRFKIVALEKNVGLGLALNAGIKACAHELIARADSDDISLPNRFKKQISYMEKHPNVWIISSSIQECDESLTHKFSMRTVPENDAEIKKFARRRSPFNHMAVVYRKSIIQSVDSYEHCMYFEDYYLWCKAIAQGGEFYNFQEPLIHARAGDSMIARRGGISYAKNICSFQKMAYQTGFMSAKDILVNLVIRVPIAVIPGSLRAMFYRMVLRGDK